MIEFIAFNQTYAQDFYALNISKIGQKLLQHAIDFAKTQNIPKLIIYSSKILENAIHIYLKHRFIEIPVEAGCPYKRCDIKMERILNSSSN